MFTNDGTDYSIELSAVRSGDKTEVTLPNGSQLALADLQTMGSGDVVVTTLNSIGDYFNFTGIATEKQLEITPDTISKTWSYCSVHLQNSGRNRWPEGS